MKKLSRKKLILYGCSGMGVNMLNIIVGSYLCSALLTGGFVEHIESWTYLNTDLVIPALWAALALGAKILDGIIDIPFAAFTNNLKTRWGRRRPSILIGLIPMVLAYVLFLVPLTPTASVLNTVWFGVLLCLFYAFYTLTMLTFYATFSEVAETESDLLLLSTTKSVCDVVYFSLGFALVPVFVSMGINIRSVALIFLPLVLTMLIPLFLLKEEPTSGPNAATVLKEKPLSLGKSLAISFCNKSFIFWMFTSAIMNVGLQLFLGGINELFSSIELNMTVVMASSFAPVPFTLILYNRIVKKYGIGVGYRYSLVLFALGMVVMLVCHQIAPKLTENRDLILTLIALFGGIMVSFALGTFFSAAYTIPTHLAKIEYETKGVTVSPMYFAVDGLFGGISGGLATGPILVWLKQTDIAYLPLVVVVTTGAAFGMSLAFPKVISKMGIAKKED